MKNAVEDFRRLNKLMKKDLAEFLGVQPSYISRIVAGEKLPSAQMDKLLNNDRGWDITPLEFADDSESQTQAAILTELREQNKTIIAVLEQQERMIKSLVGIVNKLLEKR